jgi:hypothetical protein
MPRDRRGRAFVYRHHMRTPAILALACAGAMAAAAAHPGDAEARPRPRRGKKFTANKTFGLGLMIGAPTALSGKYFYDSSKAFDFGIGGIRYYRRRNGLHVHADHLWHPISLATTQAFELPLYLGVGLRIFDFTDNNDNGAFAFGIRVPFGIAFDFNETPIDIFIELVPVVDFLVDYDDDVGFDVNGAVGIRYWF